MFRAENLVPNFSSAPISVEAAVYRNRSFIRKGGDPTFLHTCLLGGGDESADHIEQLYVWINQLVF